VFYKAKLKEKIKEFMEIQAKYITREMGRDREWDIKQQVEGVQ